MAWIRMDSGITDDPRIWALAEAIRKDVGATIGYVMCLLRKLPEQARDGNLAHIPDSMLEQWAMWPGKRGVFAAGFLSEMCEDRTVRSWMKHNGAPLRELDDKRAAMAARRAAERAARMASTQGTTDTERGGNVPPTVTPTVGPTVRNRYAPTVRNGTERNGTEDQVHTSAAGAAGVTEPDGFAVAWSAYPRRAGGNPRTSAAKAYAARIREGVTPADLEAGVRRYAAYCEAENSAGTRFVMQGATFFGPDRHWAEPYEPTDDYANDPAALAAIAARDKADADAIWIAERAAARANGVQTPATPAGVAT